MAEQKSFGKFLIYCCLILVLFLVMIPLIFSFQGRLLKLEIIVFLFLLLLSLIGFISYKCCWGERVLFFVFWIQLVNLLFIWRITDKIFILPLSLVSIGFLMSLPKRKHCTCQETKKPRTEILKDYETEFGENAQVEIVEAQDEEKEPTEKKVKTAYSPGKFVASKNSNVYHAPTCEWAKKITEERRVWFKDKREAGRKKFKKHSCVE